MPHEIQILYPAGGNEDVYKRQLIPQTELEGAMGETQVGGHARLMSHALRKLTGTIHKSRTAVIFINQIRMKIGVTGYGSPETVSYTHLDVYKRQDTDPSIKLDVNTGPKTALELDVYKRQWRGRA